MHARVDVRRNDVHLKLELGSTGGCGHQEQDAHMSETKPEAKIDPADEAVVKANEPTEIADKDLDPASGGLWPYVISSTSYNKTI
jgi:hypothetical protein